MSDHEFDNYLALLSRLLRLGNKQRDAIAGELRAHLEDRLDDLVSRGVPREEAVRQALEEFGDAAGLAAEFVSLSGKKKKRWIMRLTTASVAAIVLIAAGIFTFWPGGNAGPGAATVVAQAPDQPAKSDASASKPATAKDSRATLRPLADKLDQRIDVEFAEIPLNEVIARLQETTGIQLYVSVKKLEEAGVSVDTPITSQFRQIRLTTWLDIALRELELAYLVKDDILIITTQEDVESPESMVVRVYDCRELLALSRPPGSVRTRVTVGGGGFFAVQDEPARKSTPAAASEAGRSSPEAGAASAAPAGGSTGGGFGSTGGFGSSGGRDGQTHLEISDAENLMEVIRTTIDAESWVDVGGPGSIVEYKGLLSISATQDTHQKVERLLNMLHQAAGLKEQRVKVVE